MKLSMNKGWQNLVSLATWTYALHINEKSYSSRVTTELLIKSMHMFVTPPLVNRCRICQYLFHNHIIVGILLVNCFGAICGNFVEIITSEKRCKTFIWNNIQKFHFRMLRLRYSVIHHQELRLPCTTLRSLDYSNLSCAWSEKKTVWTFQSWITYCV